MVDPIEIDVPKQVRERNGDIPADEEFCAEGIDPTDNPTCLDCDLALDCWRITAEHQVPVFKDVLLATCPNCRRVHYKDSRVRLV